MKKRYIIAVLIILIIAISTFNFISTMNKFECEGFYIDMPVGVEKAVGYSPSDPPNYVLLVPDLDNDHFDFQSLDLSEVPLEKLPDNINIAENHTEGDLTIVKGQISDGVYPYHFDGNNVTYAEFDKEGKHFYLVINHNYRSLDQINLNDDLKLINEIKESIELK